MKKSIKIILALSSLVGLTVFLYAYLELHPFAVFWIDFWYVILLGYKKGDKDKYPPQRVKRVKGVMMYHDEYY